LKKSEILSHNCNSELELSWKFLWNFRNQRHQISKVWLVSFP